MLQREVIWNRVDSPGMEHMQLIADDQGGGIGGLVMCLVDNTPVSLRYQLYCDTAWNTREISIQTFQNQGLSLLADGEGRWTTASGVPIDSLDGCFDLDLAVTPFTNTLPIRRLALQTGEAREISVAYIAVKPDLDVSLLRQRYTCVADGQYLYENVDSKFSALLTVDSDGLVVDYPQIFKRVWSK